MRITDPRWPAVRELARIVLRTEELRVVGPAWMEGEVNDLALRLADVQPARTTFPLYHSVDDQRIGFLQPATEVELGACSLDEPSQETVWLPMNPVDGWRAIADVARDLLDAGYPGCLGCGGPHDEGVWDESLSRQQMSSPPKERS